MKRNVDLLEKVADKIEAEPERWYQPDVVSETRDCGTAYCIGGWTLRLTGANPQGESLSKATALLGLTYEEAHFLYYNGMSHDAQPMAHKEVAEWLRSIARGESVFETAPEWWED